VKTVVADAPVYSVENTDVSVHQPGSTLALWELAPIPPATASGTAAARSPPGFLTAPPDLIVVFCHFTC
jgi:hypothetical protein